MNRIHRLVWSRARSQWVAASELASAHGKSKSGRACAVRGSVRLAGWPLGLSLSLPTLVFAAVPSTNVPHAASVPSTGPRVLPATLPSGGIVTSGSGQISQSGAVLTIKQQSQNLGLGWQSFNVGAQATVNFIQPDASAIAVNRIADPNGSAIFGHLNANGQVFLINPNGVLFGQGAQVNVGGLVASTLDVNDSSLGSSHLSFSGDGRGSVVNQGTITTKPGGYAALIGQQVSNQGLIQAQLGSVALAGGSAVTLSFDGDSLVDVKVDQSKLNALAQNGQLIEANGGHVWMTAGARDSLLASVVNNTGTVDAQTVANHNGTITLLAGMQAGATNVGGSLDASAPSGGNGGAIETSAANVHVASDAKVTTKATQGQSGDWLIDPNDFTIAATGGDMTGAQLSTALTTGNVTLESSAGLNSGSGNINVDAAVNWSANTLTLTAANNININAVMTASGTAGLALNPATANGSDAAVSAGVINAMPGGGRVDFTGSGNTLSIHGASYTLISSASALQGIGASGNYALAGDIDAGSFGNFSPIGGSTGGFGGVLEGLGHVISNLTINETDADAGLVGLLLQSGVVSDLGVTGIKVSSTYTGQAILSAGAIAGENIGVIRNAFSTGTVTTLSSPGVTTAGGLVGSNSSDGVIQNAYSTAVVSVSGYAYAGGLVGGFLGGSIENAYATGEVILGGGEGFGGGLVGELNGDLQNVYATGAVSGAIGGVGGKGGLAGLLDSGNVVNAYWDTQTSGLSTSPVGTGMTTAQLQAQLPSGFDSSVWSIVAGKSFPYLVQQFAIGGTPQVISGTVYTDNGATPAGAGVTVGGVINGNALASQQTGNNGYYYFLLAPNTLSSGEGVLVYAHNYGPGNSLNGATFLDTYSGSGSPSLNIDADILSIKTSSSAWSNVLDDLAVTEGNGATSGTALGNISGSIPNIAVAASGNFTVDGSGINADDVSLNVQGNLALNAEILALNGLQLDVAGNITQSALLNVVGETSIEAPSVTLTNASNQFSGLVTVDAQNVQLSASGALTLGTSTVSDALTLNSSGALDLGQGYVGNLTATSGGAVTQGASLAGTQAAISAGANAITLNDVSFTGQVDLSNSGNNDVVFNNGTTALTLGTVAVGSGALTLSGGGITQTGAITQAAGASAAVFNGGSGNVILGNANNDLTGTVSLSTTGAGATLVNGSNTLVLGNVDASSATLDLQAGSITQSSGTTIHANTLTGSSTASVLLDNANVIAMLAGFTSNGSLSLYDDQGLTTSGAISSSGNPLTLETLAGDLTLGGALTAGGNTAQLISAGNISCNTCSLIATTLTGSAVGSANFDDNYIHINTLGSFTANGFSLYDHLSSTVQLTMSGTLNIGVSGALVVNGGSIVDSATINSHGNVLLEGTIIAINGDLNDSGNLSLLTGGINAAVTQTAPIVVQGSSTFTNGSVVLTNANNVLDGPIEGNVASIQLTANSALDFGGFESVGGITAISAGPVTQDGSIFSAQLSINAGNNPIILDNVVNHVTGAVSLSNSGNNNVVFNNGTTALTLGTLSVGSGSLTLSGNGITQTGSITQAPNAGEVGFNAGSGDATLTSTSNDLTGTVSLFGADATLVNNSNPLVLGNVNVGGGALGLQASNITQANGTAITAGSLTGDSYEAVTLTNANAVTSLDDFTAGSSFSFNDTSALTINGNIQALGGNTLITTGGNLTLGSSAALSGNNVTLVDGGVFANNAGPGVLSANGGVWQVWSQRSEDDALGGLLFDFKQYDASYGSSSELGAGNGIFYTEVPNVMLSLSNTAVVSKTYDGSNSAHVDWEYLDFDGGLIGQDSVTLSETAPLIGYYDNANAGNHKLVTVSGWNPSFSTWNGNDIVPVYGYQFNTVASNTVGTITPAPLTISASAASKVYDGRGYAGGNGVSYSGFVNGETSAVLGGTLSYGGNAQGAFNVGNYSILPGGLTSGNYAITFVPGQLSITPAPLTVTANDASKIYDGLAYAGGNGVSYSGFVNGETSSVLGGALSYGGDAQGATNVGSYTLLPSGLTSGNYDISYAAGQLSVTPASLRVTANDASKIYDGLAYVGGNGVSYSGFVNGETAAVLGGTPTYSGDAQGATGVGTYTLLVSGLTSSNYNVSYVAGQLSVAPAPLIVAANNAAKVYDGLAYAGNNGVNYSGFVNGETPSVLNGTLSYSGTAQGAVIAGSYAIVPSGLTAGNYSITFVPGQLSVTPALLTVIGNNASKMYDGLAYTGGNGVSYSGFVHGETPAVLSGTLSYGGDAQGATDAGTYAIVPGGLGASNYTITYAPGALTVTPAPLTVSANAISKTYDAQGYSGGNGVTYAGFVDGQNASVLGGALVYGGSAQGAVNTGSYTLTAGGLASGNYIISYLPGILTITPARLTYVALPGHLYSGQSPQALTGTVEGFLGDDSLANSTTGMLSWSTPATAQSKAGQYAIIGSGLSARNYLFDEAAADYRALTIGLDSLPSGVGNATAALQQQLGLIAPYAVATTSGETVRVAAMPSWISPSKDASHHGVPWHVMDPYAPDVHIVDGGMRLP